MIKDWTLASGEPCTTESCRQVIFGDQVGYRSVRWTRYGPELYGGIMKHYPSICYPPGTTKEEKLLMAGLGLVDQEFLELE